MQTLTNKGLEDLNKIRNRIARLYGMGRIPAEKFQSLNAKLLDLENEIRSVEETDNAAISKV